MQKSRISPELSAVCLNIFLWFFPLLLFVICGSLRGLLNKMNCMNLARPLVSALPEITPLSPAKNGYHFPPVPDQAPLYPAAQPRSALYRLRINGEKADVFHARKADFSVFDCHGPLDIEVETELPTEDTLVRPLSRGITPSLRKGTVRFSISGPQNLCVHIPNEKPLFLYANGPERDKPSPDDPSVRYFAAGKIYDAGQINLKSGETLYIEAGAVVRGCVRSSNSQDISIRGRGILDGSCYNFEKKELVRSIVFENCRNVSVRDLIMIESTSWMLVFGRCQGAHVDNIRQIGSVMSTDGIDICGSRDVLVENCCLRNDDDNIAIKSVELPKFQSWCGDMENIRIRRCMFWNGLPGNVMEIGYELSTESVRNVVFEDIDVITAEGEGAIFSIHNGDRAVVENILWENIRVEHYWDKLVDFRVVDSRYSKDKKRGKIRNVRLRNIQIMKSIFNLGCSVSLISGHVDGEPVEDISFEDFYLCETKVLHPDQLDLHVRNVSGIRFS